MTLPEAIYLREEMNEAPHTNPKTIIIHFGVDLTKTCSISQGWCSGARRRSVTDGLERPRRASVQKCRLPLWKAVKLY